MEILVLLCAIPIIMIGFSIEIKLKKPNEQNLAQEGDQYESNYCRKVWLNKIYEIYRR